MFISRKKLHNLLKEAFEKGLNIGSDIGYCTRKKEGTIIPGYDMDKELEEIQQRKKD